MKLPALPSMVKTKELAGPKMRVSSNCETDRSRYRRFGSWRLVAPPSHVVQPQATESGNHDPAIALDWMPHSSCMAPARRADRPGPAVCPPLGRVIGHRGAAARAPENTLAGLRRAKQLGCEAVEFDVRLTADGALVLCHDATLDRTTTGRGRVSAQFLAELF